jgi:hypothetical protein
MSEKTVDLAKIVELRRKHHGSMLPVHELLEMVGRSSEPVYADPVESSIAEEVAAPAEPVEEVAPKPAAVKRTADEAGAVAPAKKKVVVQAAGADAKPKAVPAVAKPKPKPKPKVEAMDEEEEEPKPTVPAPKPKPKPVAEAKPKPVAEAKSKPVAEAKSKPVAETKPKPAVEAKPKPVAETKPKPAVEAKPTVEAKPKPAAEKPKPKPAPKPKPDAMDEEPKPIVSAKIDTSNSKTFANTLFEGATAKEAIDHFMQYPLDNLSMLPRQNPRLTIVTILGVLTNKMIELYADRPGAEAQIKKMLSNTVAMAVRRTFHSRVVARVSTVNRPPFYIPDFNVTKNTPDFGDALDLDDVSDEAIKIAINGAMSQWYKHGELTENVTRVLSSAKGAQLHQPAMYDPEVHGAGLRCVISDEVIHPGPKEIAELEVAQQKAVISRYAVMPQNMNVVAALIVDRLPDYVMADDVHDYLKEMMKGDDSDRTLMVGALAATSALGIFISLRYVARLAAAQLVLAGVSPRGRN